MVSTLRRSSRLTTAGPTCVQQFVAHGMTQRVVDVLEAVEVDQQHGHRVPRARRGAHRLVEAIVEQRAVGQARERVAEGQVDDARLALREAVAHLAERGDEAADLVAAGGGHRAVELAVGDLAREGHGLRPAAG